MNRFYIFLLVFFLIFGKSYSQKSKLNIKIDDKIETLYSIAFLNNYFLIGPHDNFHKRKLKKEFIGLKEHKAVKLFDSLVNTSSFSGDKLFYIPFTKDILLTEKHKDELTAIEDVLMIGYPNGIWDSVNNMPIFRKGTTATNPLIDYNGKKEIMIDIAAFPGSSGSPVLIFNDSGYRDKRGNMFMGAQRVILLGVLYAGPQATTTGEIVMTPNVQRPIFVSQIPNNLGLIIKSERIIEMEKLFKQ